MTILMIEDDPALYAVTKSLLEISGYEVIGAGTLFDGLREAEQIHVRASSSWIFFSRTGTGSINGWS
jgi:DNA-binding response OmpR family regulator